MVIRQDSVRPFLTLDLISEILSRSDALTLATASCVNSDLRRTCSSPSFWRRLCHARWPSTQHPQTLTLITETGGFRNFYTKCHPSLVADLPHPPSPSPNPTKRSRSRTPADFVSIVDIKFGNQPVFSRIVPGCPGIATDQSQTRFLRFQDFPFRFDAEEEDDAPAFGGEAQRRIEEDCRRVRRALNANLTVSWIVVNVAGGEMANLASWKPIGGVCDCSCEDEFVLRFGTAIGFAVVQCDVALKVRYRQSSGLNSGSKSGSGSGSALGLDLGLGSSLGLGLGLGSSLGLGLGLDSRSDLGLDLGLDSSLGLDLGSGFGGLDCRVGIVELNMRLEDVGGVRLCGEEGLEVLDTAMSSCERTICHDAVVASYEAFRMKQVARKDEKVREEYLREFLVAVISGLSMLSCLYYVLR